MDWMSRIVEEKIQEAIERGEFNNLQGAGKPLTLDDDSLVPEDLRASYRLMKNAGVLPEELQLRKEMLTLQDLIKCCDDEREQEKLQRELSALRLRYQSVMAQRGWSASAVFREYEEKIEDKLAGAQKRS
jgi:hypothetical protein